MDTERIQRMKSLDWTDEDQSRLNVLIEQASQKLFTKKDQLIQQIGYALAMMPEGTVFTEAFIKECIDDVAWMFTPEEREEVFQLNKYLIKMG